jgi:hypothetical protein
VTNKPYNNNTWTAARFHSFIKSALRGASLKWPPRLRVKKKAWRKRGWYECAGFDRDPHLVKTVQIDHIEQIGTGDWNTIVERMFVEDDKLQALCSDCHKLKSKKEKRNG